MKELGHGLLFQVSANDAKPADGRRTAVPYIRRSRHIVVVNPLSVRSGHNALCTQYHAVGLRIAEGFKGRLDFFHCVGSCRLCAPALENFVCMMVVMLVIVVMAAAGAVRAMVMMMFMLMVVVVLMLMVVMMLVFMVVMMLMLMVVVMLVLMVVMMLVLMVMMMMVLCLGEKGFQFVVKCILLRHGLGELCACQLVPVGGNDGGGRVLFTQLLYDLI